MMNRQAGTFIAFAVVFGFLTVWLPEAGAVETPSATMPLFNIGVNQLKGAENVSVVIEIFLLLTVLSIAPAILIMLTSFTRIIIVLSLLRQAMGTQQMPPNQVLIGIALFMTVFIMTPVWQTIHQTALQPYLDKKLDPEKALEAAILPLREFMMKQVRDEVEGFERGAVVPRHPEVVAVEVGRVREVEDLVRLDNRLDDLGRRYLEVGHRVPDAGDVLAPLPGLGAAGVREFDAKPLHRTERPGNDGRNALLVAVADRLHDPPVPVEEDVCHRVLERGIGELLMGVAGLERRHRALEQGGVAHHAVAVAVAVGGRDAVA